VPAIKHHSRWGSPPGYKAEWSLTSSQIMELAKLLDVEAERIAKPLSEAAAAIGRFCMG